MCNMKGSIFFVFLVEDMATIKKDAWRRRIITERRWKGVELVLTLLIWIKEGKEEKILEMRWRSHGMESGAETREREEGGGGPEE